MPAAKPRVTASSRAPGPASRRCMPKYSPPESAAPLRVEETLRLLHNPPIGTATAQLESREHTAWQRLAFDELLAQQLSLATARKLRGTRVAIPLPQQRKLTQAFLAALPFQLTTAQARTWQEISADLTQPHPMRRLLQGDVGSASIDSF